MRDTRIAVSHLGVSSSRTSKTQAKQVLSPLRLFWGLGPPRALNTLVFAWPDALGASGVHRGTSLMAPFIGLGSVLTFTHSVTRSSRRRRHQGVQPLDKGKPSSPPKCGGLTMILPLPSPVFTPLYAALMLLTETVLFLCRVDPTSGHFSTLFLSHHKWCLCLPLLLLSFFQSSTTVVQTSV